MRRLVLTLACLLPGISAAQEDAATATLGRLFYTPAERAAVLANRRAGPVETPASASSVAVDAPASAPVPRLRLDGLVHRDDQPSVAFLNSRPVDDGGQFLDYRVVAGQRGVTLLAPDGQRIRLLVGQTLLREEGRIVDAVPAGSLSSPP